VGNCEGSPTQDNGLRVHDLAKLATATAQHSLMEIVSEKTQDSKPATETAIQPYKRFANRLNHYCLGKPARERAQAENRLIDLDLAVRRYYADLGSRRGNNGLISKPSIAFTHAAIKQFLAYSGIEVTDHAMTDFGI
jgi:hypothetical protein